MPSRTCWILVATTCLAAVLGPASPVQAEEGSNDAIYDALLWLAAHQSSNGRWEAAGFGAWCDGKPVEDVKKRPLGVGEAKRDVGVTGLALNAFLGAGHTNRGRHPFAKTVARGLRYLKNVQDAEGCFGARDHPAWLRDHARAALAMVDAFGMTGSPIFKGSAQRCLDFLAKARHPEGGWGTGVRKGKSDVHTTLDAVRVIQRAWIINRDSAKRGRPQPLRLDASAPGALSKWLDGIVDPKRGYVYSDEPRNGPQRTEPKTAAALLLRALLVGPDAPGVVFAKGADLCLALPPRWNAQVGSIDVGYWLDASEAFWIVGGNRWEAWWRPLVSAVRGAQQRTGEVCLHRGSWSPAGPGSKAGGRVFMTAMLARCLLAGNVYGHWDKGQAMIPAATHEDR